MGSFYAFCNAGCTSAANWSELGLTTDLFELPSLTFTATGQPRLATVVFGSTPQSGNLAFMRAVALPAGFGPATVPLLSLAWPPGLTPGTYLFFLALTRVNAFSDGMQAGDILALGTAAVVQSP